MSIDIKLEKFNGPMDMLLSLIERQKLPINEVSIAAVTEQYLTLVEHMEEAEPNELADFLVVAAKLLLYKSRMLIPQFGEDEDEGPSLEEQLRLYRAFVDASKHIQSRWQSGKRAVFRKEPIKRSEEFIPPVSVNLDTLHQYMVQLVSRLAPPKGLSDTTIDRAVTLKQTIASIRALLKNRRRFSFKDILAGSTNKTEVIMGFLALLELVKQQKVSLKQDSQFSDIFINRN